MGLLPLMVLLQCGDSKKPLVGERHTFLESVDSLVKDADADNISIYLPTPSRVKEWSQMGCTASHGVPHGSLRDGDRKVLWTTSIGSGTDGHRFLLSSPVVADGVVYTIDSEGRVQAHKADTGKLKWSFATEPKDTKDVSYHAGGGIGVHGDKVYVATPYGEALALEKTIGFEIWRSPLVYPARSAPTIDGERIYVSTTNNRLVALDARTGVQVWQHEGTAETTSFVGGAAPAANARVVVAPYSTGELFALRAENGHVLWTEALSSLRTLSSTSVLSQIRARPVIYQSMVIALSQGDRMMAIDFRTGRRLWDKEIGGVHTPAVTDEFIFVITNENHIACLMRDTGQVAWVQNLPRYAKPEDKKNPYRWAGPILAGGFLVATGSNGQVLFLDPTTGETKTTLSLSDAISLSPIVVEETLYFLTDRGRLIAVQ
jgi:outer membrane protein assembly factor BamB